MKTKNFDRYDESFANKEFFIGLLAGAALGVVTGILLAPSSGKDTRGKIAGAVNGKADELESEWKRTEASVGKNLDKVATKADAVADKTEDKLDEFADKAEDKASEVSKDASSIVDRLKSRFERA